MYHQLLILCIAQCTVESKLSGAELTNVVKRLRNKKVQEVSPSCPILSSPQWPSWWKWKFRPGWGFGKRKETTGSFKVFTTAAILSIRQSNHPKGIVFHFDSLVWVAFPKMSHHKLFWNGSKNERTDGVSDCKKEKAQSFTTFVVDPILNEEKLKTVSVHRPSRLAHYVETSIFSSTIC